MVLVANKNAGNSFTPDFHAIAMIRLKDQEIVLKKTAVAIAIDGNSSAQAAAIAGQIDGRQPSLLKLEVSIGGSEAEVFIQHRAGEFLAILEDQAIAHYGSIGCSRR